MIRRKSFDGAKVLGKWLVIVDGTELDEGKTKKNDTWEWSCMQYGDRDD